ncbi:acetyl/propionyl/methylcrotonyl-CoA carboxylase subunit alpha [Paucibacter soli]|uniref:acetyl/propionyl/methylcrotonyl-CoA carboxylase subunit alpha n=1 Tax=Paucibacter soli TaxID=3133433 RepID=UPI0030B0EA1D
MGSDMSGGNFSKILVANRGEIACRVMRTARSLGYRSVAVYTEPDAQSPHVAQADEALQIGSYLDIAAILDAAARTGADALHPGYGFLSERADFAQACADAGLRFIGPPAASIAAMGSKAAAKRRMLAAGVPCVPGYLGEQQDDVTLTFEAMQLGYPLLVKAVAGGGGRGMRVVQRAAELAGAIASARREAESAFGDGTLMLERLIAQGRHIEIQVFADAHGHCIHLGERDCTAQRRRQKVVEESPSPLVSPALRAAMGADAVAAAQAVGYVGAGTVEFIVDAELKQHYFLEMNTRLQVEHPVTECVTGLDLVEWQLRIAAGEPLPLVQQDVQFRGHAIEARLYVEDPYEGFRPQTGRIAWWRPELALRPGVRIDAGVAEGGELGPHYDAMVAKFIAHGRDRDDAIRRLRAALADAPLLGIANNGRFLAELLDHADFRAARLHTASLDEWALPRPQPSEADWLIAAALLLLLGEGPAAARPASVASFDVSLQHGEQRRHWRAKVGGRQLRLQAGEQVHELSLLGQDGAGRWRVALDGVQRSVIAVRDAPAGRIELARGAASFTFHEPSAVPVPKDLLANPAHARAPVAGLVAQLLVAEGDSVAEGQALLSVEAMKMEMWLTAGRAGRVKVLHVGLRESVAAGALLVELEDPA